MSVLDSRSMWTLVYTLIHLLINSTPLCHSSTSRASGGFVDLPWDTTITSETMDIVWNSTYLNSTTLSLPYFLNGTLYRVLPAIWRFNSSDQQVNNPHWYNGLSMIISFKFNVNSSITYNTHFMNTTEYNQYNPYSNYKSKYTSFNTDITIRRVNGDVLLANSGELISNSFHTTTAKTVEAPYFYNDTIWSYYHDDNASTTNSPSHGQYDPDTNEFFHYFLNWNDNGEQIYSFYHLKANTNTRILSPHSLKPLNKLKIPLYQHSFGLTKNYRIICEQPQLVSVYKPGKWTPNMNTTWYIIDRYSGQLIKTFISLPFAYYHWINSYEINNDTIIVDLLYDSDNGGVLYDSMYINNMLYNYTDFIIDISCKSKMLRFTLNLNDMNDTLISGESVSNLVGYELPVVNPSYNTKPYRYFYAEGTYNCVDPGKSQFYDTIVKIDVTNNDADKNYKVWFQDYDQYPGEPIFVANPEGNAEDDGILLSVVFNGNTNSSYLLILNATDLTEIGRAHATMISHIPLGFHGKYYRDL